MLKSYLKTAVRSLIKNKVFTLINVFGVFIGLTAFLSIYAYVDFERSYDAFHDDSDRIYRVVTDNVVNGVVGTRDAMSFSPLGKTMKAEIPEVGEYTTTMKMYEDLIFQKGDELLNETEVVAADERFLDIFSYKLLYSEPEPLKDPNTLVLTRSAALRLFDTENPVGQTIKVLGIHKGNYKVTGVIEDLPRNTHYKFDILLSFATIQDRAEADGWQGYNFYTYVKLTEEANAAEVQAKLGAFPEKYLDPSWTLQFTMQPIEEIHLTSGFTYEPEAVGNAQTVRFLMMIAVFIVLIAWVNYINLATARSMDRAREVGIRKVSGAGKWQLFSQFMAEAHVINILAAILAITVVQIMGPVFNALTGQALIDDIWEDAGLLRILLLITSVGALLSGFYPAVVLSSFKPITVLKGQLIKSGKGLVLRKTLVVFQFVASLMLITGTAVVYLQIDFMKNHDLGVDFNQTMSIKMPSYDAEDEPLNHQKYKLLKTELAQLTQVKGSATSSSIPGGGRSNIAGSSGGLSMIGVTEINKGTYFSIMTDEDFFPTLEVDMIAGRNFNELPEEKRNVIVNEALLKYLGFSGTTEEALGQRLRFGDESSTSMRTIVGVVKDFNRRSLKDAVEPTVYHKGYDSFMTNFVIKLSSKELSATVKAVEEKWFSVFPEVPFEYSFMDKEFDKAYAEDRQFGSVFGVFSLLAITIAALGLFGLSSFVALQRSKEIGVRKVLGASVMNIVKLISSDFLKLVLVAFLVGSPLVFWLMNNWLDNYAFRIDLPVWLLPFAGILLLAITFATVGYQTLGAAGANPVDTLRSE